MALQSGQGAPELSMFPSELSINKGVPTSPLLESTLLSWFGKSHSLQKRVSLQGCAQAGNVRLASRRHQRMEIEHGYRFNRLVPGETGEVGSFDLGDGQSWSWPRVEVWQCIPEGDRVQDVEDFCCRLSASLLGVQLHV